MQEHRVGRDYSASKHEHPQEKSVVAETDDKHSQEGSIVTES